MARLRVHSSIAPGYFWKSVGAVKFSNTKSPPRFTLKRIRIAVSPDWGRNHIPMNPVGFEVPRFVEWRGP